jgi:plastocyanin
MKQNPLNFSPVFFLGIVPLGLLIAHAHAAEIAIVGDGSSVPYRFDPANVTVKLGDKVTWVNKTNVEHSVTPDAAFKKRLKDKDIEASKAYSTIIKAGPLKYHCKYHPGMRAMIVVSAR